MAIWSAKVACSGTETITFPVDDDPSISTLSHKKFEKFVIINSFWVYPDKICNCYSKYSYSYDLKENKVNVIAI